MFCRKCGKEIFDNSEYCEDCKKASQAVMQTDNSKPVQRKKCCPKCKSRNMQIVTNTEFSSQTTGGGYSAGKGCCGYILLGPLGLLCGGCGSKSKTTVTSESTTVWTCLDCGNKFRDIADIEKEIENTTKRLKFVPIACYIIGIVNFLVFLAALASSRAATVSAELAYTHFAESAYGQSQPAGGGLLPLVILLLVSIVFIVEGISIHYNSVKRIAALNEEKKEIERNGYIDE